jgi:hypothetical protein
MINADMRNYDYYLYDGKDAYGQEQLTAEPQGKIKMAINITSQTVQDNINYNGANYIGVTQALVNDSFVIAYNNEKLKVLYVNPKGRFKQVFLVKI